MSKQTISELYNKVFLTLDCKDNSCRFIRKNEYGLYGMRTNGGCRCLKSLPGEQRRAIVKLLLSLKDCDV